MTVPYRVSSRSGDEENDDPDGEVVSFHDFLHTVAQKAQGALKKDAGQW